MHIKHFSIKILKVHCNLEARFIQITLHNALKDVVQSWTVQLLIKISGCKDEYFSNLTFDWYNMLKHNYIILHITISQGNFISITKPSNISSHATKETQNVARHMMSKYITVERLSKCISTIKLGSWRLKFLTHFCLWTI